MGDEAQLSERRRSSLEQRSPAHNVKITPAPVAPSCTSRDARSVPEKWKLIDLFMILVVPVLVVLVFVMIPLLTHRNNAMSNNSLYEGVGSDWDPLLFKGWNRAILMMVILFGAALMIAVTVAFTRTVFGKQP